VGHEPGWIPADGLENGVSVPWRYTKMAMPTILMIGLNAPQAGGASLSHRSDAPRKIGAGHHDRDQTMKNTAFVIAAAIALSASASGAGAMNLGSLSRQSPIAASLELAAMADPAVCSDATCGLAARQPAAVAPVMHLIFASLGGLVEKARLQVANAAARG
jgi:hypothetical protein